MQPMKEFKESSSWSWMEGTQHDSHVLGLEGNHSDWIKRTNKSKQTKTQTPKTTTKNEIDPGQWNWQII